MPLPRTLSTALGVSLATIYIVYFWHERSKKRRLISSKADLKGNFYAGGTDVVRLYAPQGRRILITGTTSGLGKHIAQLLTGCHLICGVRRPSEMQSVIAEIQASGGTAVALELDLASLSSVGSFAKRVHEYLQGEPIDVIIHNAGLFCWAGSSEDGLQAVWQVNAMAPALLTELLLPCLAKDGRVVNVSSQMYELLKLNPLRGEWWQPPHPQRGGSSYDYAVSKACQVAHAIALNDTTFRGTGRRAFATEPGLVPTRIGRHLPQWMLQLEYTVLGWFFITRTIDQGTSSTLYCALADDVEDGVFFANCRPIPPARLVQRNASQVLSTFSRC